MDAAPAQNKFLLDKSASYDNIISENTLSLLKRVFSPMQNSGKIDELFEEMPETSDN